MKNMSFEEVCKANPRGIFCAEASKLLGEKGSLFHLDSFLLTLSSYHKKCNQSGFLHERYDIPHEWCVFIQSSM